MGTKSLNTIDLVFCKPDGIMVSLELVIMLTWVADCSDNSSELWVPLFLSQPWGLHFIPSSKPILFDSPSVLRSTSFPLARPVWALTATESRPLESSRPPLVKPRLTSTRYQRQGLPQAHHLGNVCSHTEALKAPSLVKSNLFIAIGGKTRILNHSNDYPGMFRRLVLHK